MLRTIQFCVGAIICVSISLALSPVAAIGIWPMALLSYSIAFLFDPISGKFHTSANIFFKFDQQRTHQNKRHDYKPPEVYWSIRLHYSGILCICQFFLFCSKRNNDG